ncbi:hypothetical protein GCM10009120_04850 [Sphingobacterium siyangense subsp. cladoniae]|uniref:hypothetical protein n=1 Tax=Sphingobacterium siyangense TaxID=459529 RepID=UPI0031F7B892
MGKITNIDLAAFVSKRILEILDLTGLTTRGLANFTEITEIRIRGYCNKSLTISVEAVGKICSTFSISISHFFDESTALRIDIGEKSNFHYFRSLFFPLGKKFFLDEIENERSTLRNLITDNRYQRECIAYVVLSSEYFSEPKTVEEMIENFENTYKIAFKAERINLLLRKYVSQGYLVKRSLSRGFSRSRQYIYQKAEEQPVESSGDDFAIIEISNVLNR